MKNGLQKYWWILLPAVLIVLFLVNISLGSVKIPLADTVKVLTGGEPANPVWASIIFDFRLTKAFTCVLAGGALALGGLLMQTLFRNPLAGPDVLGLTSGASLAVAILLLTGGLGAVFSSSLTIAVAASFGCTGVFLIVLAVAHRIKDNVSLLVIGLMIGAVTSAIVSVLQYMSQIEDLQYYIVWTFGSMNSINWNEILILTVVVMIGSCLAFSVIKPLNAWLLGDQYTTSMGISLKRSRLLIIIAASMLTGVVTAFCGPIAFVGLAVPHVTRLLIDTTNHKILIPAVLIAGAAITLFCDILTRLPGNDFIIPINVMTALIGAPVVIWVIVRSKKIRI